ncbi:perilipin-2-like [Oncorhynchus nerka]|uniref:perilipin-2-like n=1 Tax=Oncorhynchus nerka TaxID=8023 RepID=UPI0011302A56|nr:perilipin-2-like [Oncorhynchus nerka]XP_029530489.1 perilipin-2-like [Oncorhynchus nerka]
MEVVEVVNNQNVVERVTSLPLVSSTYDMVSSAYCTTKDNHPYLKSMCEVAEQGVRNLTTAALTGAAPIIGKLEPQISMANDLACKGLDKIEKTLPILHQPSEQIVANAKYAVTGAKDVMSNTVTGAKDSVSHTLTNAVDRTRGAVQDGVEMTRAAVQDRMQMTRAAVSGSVNTVMESRVAQMVSSGMDTALTTSESLVDQYLPCTEDELEIEAKMVEGFDVAKDAPSYYVRLGSLSTKLRKRAYHKALAQVKDAKQRSQESISQLNHTVDLIEYTRKNIDGANQKVKGKLSSLIEWKSNEEADGNEAENIESRTLAIARSLTQQLQTTCQVLVSGLQGLPQNIQKEALFLSHSASQVYSSFSKAAAFGDLSDGVLASSKAQLGKMKESLDGVMDYLVNNTSLNWLVGPFYPRLAPPPTTTSSQSQKTPAPAEVEMKSME